ncbi:MAG TPA: hypothetical protein DDZ51_20485 [Planctomycetaceae bacterium]|nr:hypothetical protein [Planctomycetaceae bacterium]
MIMAARVACQANFSKYFSLVKAIKRRGSRAAVGWESKMRIAIMGTYRCGSSAVAKSISQLGVHLGAPFFGDYFESDSLSALLRQWWNEPEFRETVARDERITQLRHWIEDYEESLAPLETDGISAYTNEEKETEKQSHDGSEIVCGAKHPLLSLSASDIEAAWGKGVRYIWVRRELKDTIESLKRLNWWQDCERIQSELYEAAERFVLSRTNDGTTFIVDFDQLQADPLAVIGRVSDFLGLRSSKEKIESACRHIRRSTSQRTEIAGNRQRPTFVDQVRIAATMISGNSESMVKDAIETVIDYVDEVVLIDTGISDATERLISEVAGDRLRVTKRVWDNDFAGMRNAALIEAQASGCNWSLTIDTDERVNWGGCGPDQLRRRLLESEKAKTFMVAAQDGSYAKERLIRVPTSLHWAGRTHEALIGAAADERPVLPGVTFWELPKSTSQMEHKLKRDLTILREEVCDKPNNARWWYFLGQTLAALGQHEGAVEALDRCANLRQWSEQSAWASFMAAKSLSELGRFGEAVERCGMGLACDPEYPELAWMAAWCEYRAGRLRNAIAWSQMSIAIGHAEGTCEGADRVGFRNLVGWYEGPLDVLRFAFRRQGRNSEADRVESRYQVAKAIRIKKYGA